MSYGASWGVFWGLGLQRPAWASLPPAVIRGQERDGTLAPGSAAELGGVIVTKRVRGTLRPELVVSAGPYRLGQPGGGTLAELYGGRWSLALYKGGPRLYQAQAGVWVDRSDPDALGELVDVRHVALAFDQAARPVFGWERDGLVFVRQWNPAVQAYVTRGPWAGREPLLMCDAVLHGEPSASDVVLMHLSGAQLVARHQRDSYAVPAVVADAVPDGAVLDQIIPGPLAWQAAGEASRAPLTLRSGLYPAHLHGQTRGRVSGPSGGALMPVTKRVQVADGHAWGTVTGLSAGALVPSTLLRPLADGHAWGTVTGLSAGALRPVVITAATGPDAARGTVTGLAAGMLRRAVIVVSRGPDAVRGTVSGLTGGSLNAQ
ncbi:hypothetical protein AUC44_09935 [Deinococcus actinosclerus]|uniref:Uncharacterized protein n=1 Tax=Deinococcus actinosclerus TaxID=1768108 RepID=A0ABN4K509_9DEIO|nr:hypothetical protein AUC44_09935 [Deinococcus actinosclerus]